MKLLIVLAAMFLIAASTDVDHENWRRYKSEVDRLGLSNVDQRRACDEPYVHGLPFNCDVEVSNEIPTSVHKLSPGDVKVVGAIGDSITAANGAHACNLGEVFNEYRGASWSIGGDDNFTQALTLPNILRLYNPDLIGFSLGVGKVDSETSHFNCAVPGSIATDMPEQAENLVNRIIAHPDVDVLNDWKVITLFIGGNDLCEHCNNPMNYTKEDYIESISKALDHFHEKLPRTFVNVVGLINMTQLVLQEDFVCKLVHNILCNCIVNLREPERLKLEKLNLEYQDVLRELASSGRYNTTDDFTVVYQPFMEGTAFPLGEDGKVDQSYMAPDCFHLSAKGHAFAARELWNNMLQPVGRKSRQWNPFASEIPCQSKERPYFGTIENSNNLKATTEQAKLTEISTKNPGPTIPVDQMTTEHVHHMTTEGTDSHDGAPVIGLSTILQALMLIFSYLLSEGTDY